MNPVPPNTRTLIAATESLAGLSGYTPGGKRPLGHSTGTNLLQDPYVMFLGNRSSENNNMTIR
jgi:hypothetical protein